jgi:small-conductance mechanosensitive channel
MKTDPIPTICLTALTLMTGAIISHWMGIDERVDLARMRAGQPLISPVMPADEAPAAELPATADAQLVAHRRTTPRAAASEREDSPELGQRLVRALEGFEQLQRENRNLRDQVAETNRDLMELQFRVDTHSESFRPLRATQEIEQPISPGVLPPLEIP